MPPKFPTGRLVNLTDRNSGALIPLPFRPDRGDMSLSGDPALAAAAPCEGPAGMPSEPLGRRRAVTPSSSTFRLGSARRPPGDARLAGLDGVRVELDPGRLDLPDRGAADAPRRLPHPELQPALHARPVPSVWASTTLAPLDYTWAVVVTVGLSVLSVLAWALALAEVFGENSRALLALALVALSRSSCRPACGGPRRSRCSRCNWPWPWSSSSCAVTSADPGPAP
jgi:hypothetical protein